MNTKISVISLLILLIFQSCNSSDKNEEPDIEEPNPDENTILCSAIENEDAYTTINNVFAPGYSVVEVPDCSHGEFGPHIDTAWDEFLEAHVFRFHIHVTPDDDRCINDDRQRNEIKVYDKSPEFLQGIQGDTYIYKWKFKLDADFQSSKSFTHIHQLKSVGSTEDAMPLITLTTRLGTPDKLEIRYAANLTQVTVHEQELEDFKGTWLEVTEEVTYNEEGSYSISITDIENNKLLLEYSDDKLRTWKTEADFIRPKWGVYRSLNNEASLRDEILLYNDFYVEKVVEE